MTHTKMAKIEAEPSKNDVITDRVGAFEKNAQEMIQILLRVYVQLLGCEDDQEVDDMKMNIAPEAASLISQGDTLAFEANGMPELLSQRMLDIQRELREKFKRVQMFKRSGSEKSRPTTSDYKERERELNKNLGEIEEIIEKVLKQTKDLLGQTWNDSSVNELSNRISHIKVSTSARVFTNTAAGGRVPQLWPIYF